MGRIAAPASLITPWNLACPDWADRLRDGRSLLPDLPLDMAEAERAVRVFDNLRIPDVIGQPFMRDAAGDWFRDIVRGVFGSWSDETQTRYIRDFFALVPKKNSKTTGGAGIMLTALLLNKRPHAQFLLIGPTQGTADLAFTQASGMIGADPDLAKLFLVQDHQKKITFRPTRATLQIKSFDMSVMTGVKPVGVLVDELHVMSASSYASRVIGQIRGGLLANPEGFLIFITTQSDTPPSGVFKTELKYARAIRDGTEKGQMLPFLYELPEEIQTDPAKPWRNVDFWPMVTPNLGKSITVARLHQDFLEAEAKGDDELRRWASQHLNIEIGLALHNDRWNGADFWERSGDQKYDLAYILKHCEVVTVGIDGGGLDDLLGFAIIGRERETKRWIVWGRAWADEGVLKLRKDIAEKLRDFERDGDLAFIDLETGEDGAAPDMSAVADIVKDLWDAGLLPEENAIGLDAVGVAAIVDHLQSPEVGIPGECLAAVPQGYRLSGVIKGAARKLKDGSLKHGSQPLMAWCVGNARNETRGNSILITKQQSGSAKIDPLMAFFNAFELMSRNPVAKGRSVYGERGLLVV